MIVTSAKFRGTQTKEYEMNGYLTDELAWAMLRERRELAGVNRPEMSRAALTGGAVPAEGRWRGGGFCTRPAQDV